MLRLSSPIYLELLAICLISSSAPFSKPSYFSSSLVKKFTKQSNGFLTADSIFLCFYCKSILSNKTKKIPLHFLFFSPNKFQIKFPSYTPIPNSYFIRNSRVHCDCIIFSLLQQVKKIFDK